MQCTGVGERSVLTWTITRANPVIAVVITQGLHMSFDDGFKAAEKLVSLFADIGATEPLDLAPPDQVETVLNALWARSTKSAPSDLARGFFTHIVTKTGYSDTDIISLWGVDTLLQEQDDCAPICNIPNDAGIFAFADWTGESDGDAWCFDIKYNCLRCIPVSSGYSNADQSRLESYGVFPKFDHLSAYLRCEANLRGWVSSRPPQDSP